jgi:DNA-binding MarR family transcriptional regulator
MYMSQETMYRELISLMMRAKRHMFAICETRKMTPVQGMLLMALKPGQSRTMQELAQMMGCDASNITGLIERLESQGFIERTTLPNDRRVKLIGITEAGLSCRQSILEELAAREAIDIKCLTQEESECFKKALHKLTETI